MIQEPPDAKSAEGEDMMKALSVVSLILSCVAAAVSIAAAVINVVSIHNSKFSD